MNATGTPQERHSIKPISHLYDANGAYKIGFTILSNILLTTAFIVWLFCSKRPVANVWLMPRAVWLTCL